MDVPTLSGRDFARLLATGDAHEELAGPGGGLVVVDADGPSEALAPEAAFHLATLPAVVVGATVDPGRRAPWADVHVAPGSRPLAAVVDRVRSAPVAATVLALLLRGGETRTVADGLVAESTAYGLLQGAPEFDRWRAGRPGRTVAPSGGPAVRAERCGGELHVTLCRPERRNALDAAMRDGLVEALAVAVADRSVTAVHLWGEGASFCSGGDLDEFGSRPDPAAAHLLRLVRSPARTLAALADRTVAHLHGDAVGSGIELAAFARTVVADPATRIALPEVGLGLLPGSGGTVSLPRRIGRHRTLWLALAVDAVDAATALEWGLVDTLAGRPSRP